MAFKLHMTVGMHGIHTCARFDDFDLDFEYIWKARPCVFLAQMIVMNSDNNNDNRLWPVKYYGKCFKNYLKQGNENRKANRAEQKIACAVIVNQVIENTNNS